ncbi:MAG: substrate-binding domain-containing protein [Deltaproteobacteria bacterium]|nr:substrate-binding domain-containing protein [Deltaproteobacteria bacterium]
MFFRRVAASSNKRLQQTAKAAAAEPWRYTSVNENGMKILERSGHINNDDYYFYLQNRLTLMVQEGNPVNINSVPDMGRE